MFPRVRVLELLWSPARLQLFQCMLNKAGYHNKLSNCHSFEWYLELNGFFLAPPAILNNSPLRLTQSALRETFYQHYDGRPDKLLGCPNNFHDSFEYMRCHCAQHNSFSIALFSVNESFPLHCVYPELLTKRFFPTKKLVEKRDQDLWRCDQTWKIVDKHIQSAPVVLNL